MSAQLLFDLDFGDLYTYEGIQKIHHAFLAFLKDCDEQRFEKLVNIYNAPQHILEDDVIYQDFCVEFAPFVEDFLGYLFKIFSYVQLLQERHQAFSCVAKVKRVFIQRYVMKSEKDIPNQKPILPFDVADLSVFDLMFSKAVLPLIGDLHHPPKELNIFIDYALWAMFSEEGRIYHQSSILFNHPIKKSAQEHFFNTIEHSKEKGYFSNHLQKIDGRFSCTDEGIPFSKSVDQANYCIQCHPRKKDSCRTGFFLKDEKIHGGCPLDEKISAMMIMKNKGYSIASLTIVCIDNPMVAATGHRICNDCRLACIYQKQESVDVPGVESSVLKDVLQLPYGFEIYSLLTRWNPLCINHPTQKKETGHTVLVVGQGPAGFGIANHLIKNGVRVLAIDGNKIEPLPSYLKNYRYGIKDIHFFFQDLDERFISGFGGVTEYGITARWNKNNLLIIRLILERHFLYTLKGGIHFGSNITQQQALEMGFDHIALCMGAGSPKMLEVNKKMPKGVSFASDFLMSLQLSGAYQKNSWANLTIDMPVVVIGGGLTAIDTATEAQRYYIRQIEKIYERANVLKQNGAFDIFYNQLNDDEKKQFHRWYDHAQEWWLEKEKALSSSQPLNAIPLLHKWGGVTVLYRKDFHHAPALKLNVEEVQHALNEGIFIQDQASDIDFMTTELGVLKGVSYKDQDDHQQIIHTQTALIAIGTHSYRNY